MENYDENRMADEGTTNPPSYEQAIEPPPSYQSIFGEIRHVRKDSSNVLEFLANVVILLASTIGVAIFLGILLAIPITMIVLGAVYKDKCPAEDKIPIYLIVMGIVLVVRNLSNLCSKATSSDDGDSDEADKAAAHKCCDSIFELFIFCWFISGNYWIYHIYAPSYSSSDGDYCNKTLYLFSFWLMTASYILIGFLCCCACTVGVCYVAFGGDDDDD